VLSELKIFSQALWLGLRGFGGPAAHLKLFSKELVGKDKWVDESEFRGLVSLASLLPGPTSSQVGIALGLERGGLLGAAGFWLGFTLPSALAMFVLTYLSFTSLNANTTLFWILKIAIALVIAHSVRQLAKRFVVGRVQFAITLVSAAYYFFASNPYLQAVGLVVSALVGLTLIKSEAPLLHLKPAAISRNQALTFLALGLVVIAASPLFIHFHSWGLQTFGRFVQVGSLAFGGGHVILPLLQSRFVTTHLISSTTFARGYFFAQFMPGPLFSVAVFIGASIATSTHSLSGAIQALCGIFLPGALLMLSGTYFWKGWSQNKKFVSAIAGVNASVIGLLCVACIDILRLART